MSMALDPVRGRAGLGVQSIEVGLRLLRPLIDAGRPLNLTALAKTAGFAAPKARRYLVSLIRAGLVEQDPQTGRYGFGALAIEVGLNALGLLDHNRLARQALSELEVEVGQSTCLAVWTPGGPTVMAVESSPQEGIIFVAMRVGSTLPLLSASGRIFLAHLPREITAPLLQRERKRNPTSATQIAAIVEQIKRQGYAASKDATVPGISAISAPIFNHDGQLVYALTCFGPTVGFEVSPRSKFVRALRSKAEAVCARLGHRNGAHSGTS